jgi:hypothetical protein
MVVEGATMGRRRKLTDEEVLGALRRMDLYLANCPKKIVADLGMCHATLSNILCGRSRRYSRLLKQHRSV